ncbi:MAG: UTP--glucose-1-phosphate uridylyltransferase GalU [Alphaproteobacteria bacterium]|nr:UTP--glucose-1-phosphate uridylyltransferase GalU [Alphaproteobacteria bacterium]OJV16095.1 MAG: UTP--glucose-1-phosphate uridylyltransferase [Alphaproteobacteria bacterium 33-17]
MKKIKKVIFPVGGLGTRFLPVTKSLPKEMLPVASKPLIQYAFEEAQNAGIELFLFVTGRNKNTINNHFDHAYELQSVLDEKQKKDELSMVKGWLPDAGSIAFVRQQEPLGLGHAVYCARNFIGNEPFAVILADEMLKCEQGFLKEMVDVYNEYGSPVVGVAEVERDKTNSYGIIDADKLKNNLYKIKNMVEKPDPKDAPSNLSIVGRYILEPEIFDILANQSKGKGGEVQLTDAMIKMLENKDFYALEFKGDRYDCGNQVGFLDANIGYMYDNPEFHYEIKSILGKYK